uniref:Secreted protein n=1 Tax=Solanum tuberosum TaxID=4113 RepID=M1CWP2_SOLTU
MPQFNRACILIYLIEFMFTTPIESCSVPIRQEASQNIEPNFWKYRTQRLWSSGQSTSCDVCRRTSRVRTLSQTKACN